MNYVVGTEVFTNKYLAFANSKKTGNPIRFNLYEQAFDNASWDVEPNMSWDAMLDIRAQQLANNELQVKAREMQGKEEYERWKAELDAATKIMVARIGSNPGVDLPVIEAASAQITNELGGTIVQAMDKMALMHDQMANLHGQTMQNIGEAMQRLNAPKKVVRGADGLVIGVETA